MGRKILAGCIVAMLLLSCVTGVFAEEFDREGSGSVSVTLTEQYSKTPIVGAELSMYYIATIGGQTEKGFTYIPTEDFACTGLSLDAPDLVTKLEDYLSRGSLPAIKLTTDGDGSAICGDLPLGLYFIRQSGEVEGYAPCTAFLVTLPMKTEGGYVYDVNASPKTEVARLTDITVRKLWNTDSSAKATDSVTVQLLRKGVVIGTATLHEGNDWQVTYKDLPESDSYSIKEVDVPKGFTATYRQEGYVFTVTNSTTLINTGQLKWPIPVLAVCGMLLLSLGVLLRGDKRDQDA